MLKTIQEMSLGCFAFRRVEEILRPFPPNMIVEIRREVLVLISAEESAG